MKETADDVVRELDRLERSGKLTRPVAADALRRVREAGGAKRHFDRVEEIVSRGMPPLIKHWARKGG